MKDGFWNRASNFTLAGMVVLSSMAMELRADRLTFSAQNSNFDWFSSDNWFTNNAAPPHALAHAGHIPVPVDTAVISGGVNAAANTITLNSLILNPNASVSGGRFIVTTLVQMMPGSGGGTTTFTGSSVDVLTEMDVLGGSCALNTTALTIEKGAVCQVGDGATGMLGLTDASIFNAGQIILSANSKLDGGTNIVNFPGAIISGITNAAVMDETGNRSTFNNSGTIRCDGGTLQVTIAAWTSTNGLGKFKTTTTNALIVFSSGLTVPTNVTYIFSGPGITQMPQGATILGTAQVGVFDTNLLAWDPGTLQFSATLTGTGMVHVAAAPGFTSELDEFSGGAILNGPTVNVDSGGILSFLGGSFQMTTGVVNNAGTTLWKKGDLTINAPSIFNNPAGGLFDCQITNTSTDGNLFGNGTINNAGTFRKSRGTNAIAFGSQGPAFNNSSLLDVQSGRMQFSRGTNSGTFNLAPGAEIWFTGSTNWFVTGAKVTGTNFVRIPQFGNVIINTNLTLANFSLQGGTLDGLADLTVSNVFNWSNGTMQGGGGVNIPPGTTLNASGAGTLGARTINNSGVVIMTNGFEATSVGSVFNNLAGGLLEIHTAGGFGFPNPSPTPRPVLNNFGTIRTASASAAPLAFVITNRGVVQVQSNSLNCYQYQQISGTTTVATNGILNVGDSIPLGLQGGIFNCGGTIQGVMINSGGTLSPGNTPNITGLLTVGGGTGNYTQTVAGVLSIKIGGTNAITQYDRMTAGSAVLGGTLNVSFINGFNPSPGDNYAVVTAQFFQAVTGSFSTLTGLHATNGVVLVPVYGPFGVTLVAAGDPILKSPVHKGTNFVFSFQTTTGFTNVVEFTGSLNPANWQPLVTNIGDGTVKSVTNSPITSTNRFYRVRFQ